MSATDTKPTRSPRAKTPAPAPGPPPAPAPPPKPLTEAQQTALNMATRLVAECAPNPVDSRFGRWLAQQGDALAGVAGDALANPLAVWLRVETEHPIVVERDRFRVLNEHHHARALLPWATTFLFLLQHVHVARRAAHPGSPKRLSGTDTLRLLAQSTHAYDTSTQASRPSPQSPPSQETTAP